MQTETIQLQCECGNATAEACEGHVDIAPFLREQIAKGWCDLDADRAEVTISSRLPETLILVAGCCPTCRALRIERHLAERTKQNG